MFDPAYKYSFLRYWRDVTAGTRDIEATVHPWRNIGTAQNDIDKLEGLVPISPLGDSPLNRRSPTAARYLATKFPKSLPSSFDGLVIFVSTSGVTGQPATPAAAGGAAGALIDETGYPAAYLNLGAAFNFYVHEIGHVLGSEPARRAIFAYQRSMGDLRRSGGRSCRRRATAQPIPHSLFRPAAGALRIRCCGVTAATTSAPGPAYRPRSCGATATSRDAMARVHRAQCALGAEAFPVGASPTLIKLYRAGTSNHTTLVAIPSSTTDPYWTTFEYRPASGRDRGLGHGPGLIRPDLDRPHPGVVVHRILREDGAPKDGARRTASTIGTR